MSNQITSEAPTIDAVVKLPESWVPLGVQTWYHVSWHGISAWIPYHLLSKRAGWRPWYERFPALTDTPRQLYHATFAAAWARCDVDTDPWAALQRDPTPAELLDFTDSATWPAGCRSPWPLHCPTCHYGWCVPEDRAYHTRHHRRIATELEAAFRFADLPEYNPDKYEQFKHETRRVFRDYDEQGYTRAERAEAAIRYLRVQCCQQAFSSVRYDSWVGFLARHTDFTAWVRTECAHYMHEFDDSVIAAIRAAFGPVISKADYDAMEAECLRVHTDHTLSAQTKERELVRIVNAYRRRQGESEAQP